MGTLVHPREPVAHAYARAAASHGAELDETEIAARVGAGLQRYRPLRALDPGWRAYWAAVVADATGCDDEALLDELYDHFARASAWTLAEGAQACCERVRAAGLRVVVVSNFDVRLRPLLRDLGVERWIDAAVVSAEEGVEKPDPEILRRAAAKLGVEPTQLVHVGDEQDDEDCARRAGCEAWRWGRDVASFPEIAARLTE